MPELHHPGETKAGWDVDKQIRDEARLTKGRVIVRGKLAARDTATFVTSAGLQS